MGLLVRPAKKSSRSSDNRNHRAETDRVFGEVHLGEDDFNACQALKKGKKKGKVDEEKPIKIIHRGDHRLGPDRFLVDRGMLWKIQREDGKGVSARKAQRPQYDRP